MRPEPPRQVDQRQAVIGLDGPGEVLPRLAGGVLRGRRATTTPSCPGSPAESQKKERRIQRKPSENALDLSKGQHGAPQNQEVKHGQHGQRQVPPAR